MKHSATLLFASGMIAAIAFASCSADRKADNDTVTFKKIEATKAYSLKGSAVDFETPADQSYGLQVQLLMPENMFGKDIAALRDSILDAAFDTTGTDLNTMIERTAAKISRENGYTLADTVLPDSVVRDTPRFTARFNGFYSIEGDVETLSASILSYAVTVSYYMPSAAHGMYNIRYINYDLTAGKVLTLADVFTAEGIAALPEIIRDYAVRMEASIGSTDITEIPCGGNFYLTPDGEIVFSYQPYEVASYAQGEIQIPIPAYILSQYLTPAALSLLL